jgi:hypothetical protein
MLRAGKAGPAKEKWSATARERSEAHPSLFKEATGFAALNPSYALRLLQLAKMNVTLRSTRYSEIFPSVTTIF